MLWSSSSDDYSRADAPTHSVHIGFPISTRCANIRPIAMHQIAVQARRVAEESGVDISCQGRDARYLDGVEHHWIKDLHAGEKCFDKRAETQGTAWSTNWAICPGRVHHDLTVVVSVVCRMQHDRRQCCAG